MKLYHGTNIDFDEIDLSKSKPNKDFGCGFYLSSDYEQAHNMANIKFEQMETGKPLVQEYSIDEIEMKKLKCLIFDNLLTLVKRLKYMKGITIQYFFGTERAIKLLKRL